VLLELGDVLVQADKLGAAVMHLDISCGNGSCLQREPSLSARLAERGVPHVWTRDGTVDPFRLLPFMADDWFRSQATDTLPEKAKNECVVA